MIFRQECKQFLVDRTAYISVSQVWAAHHSQINLGRSQPTHISLQPKLQPPLLPKGRKIIHVTTVAHSFNSRRIVDKPEISLPVKRNQVPNGTEYQNWNQDRVSELVWVWVPSSEKLNSVSAQYPGNKTEFGFGIGFVEIEHPVLEEKTEFRLWIDLRDRPSKYPGSD